MQLIHDIQHIAERLEVDFTIFSEWQMSQGQAVITFHFRVESPRPGESDECGPYDNLSECVKELHKYLWSMS
jgi:hypothetical protein